MIWLQQQAGLVTKISTPQQTHVKLKVIKDSEFNPRSGFRLTFACRILTFPKFPPVLSFLFCSAEFLSHLNWRAFAQQSVTRSFVSGYFAPWRSRARQNMFFFEPNTSGMCSYTREVYAEMKRQTFSDAKGPKDMELPQRSKLDGGFEE
jgi:hypothetical protein